MRRQFFLSLLTAAACWSPATLVAQQGPPPPPEKGSIKALIDEAVSGYTQMKTIILASADKMPAENFSFKPTPDIRNYGELFTHVAQVQLRLCGTLSGQATSVPTQPPPTTKEDIISFLKKSFDACDAANTSITEANAMEISGGGFMRGSKIGLIQKNVAHDNEMYGQMVVYMRLKGIVPPSTAMRNRP